MCYIWVGSLWSCQPTEGVSAAFCDVKTWSPQVLKGHFLCSSEVVKLNMAHPPRLALVIGWPWTQEKFRLAKQLGVSDIVGGPPVPPGQPRSDVWEFLPLLHQKRMVEDVGLKLEVIESNPPMDEIIFGLPGRDRQTENFCKTLRNMGAAGYSVRAYKEVGFDGPMSPDHVPTMEGDNRFMGGHAGYTMLGRLYAIGYMKGLIDAIYGKQ